METEFTTVFHARTRPKIITLCGSTRFTHAFQQQQFQLSMRGYIVCGPAMDKKIDDLFHLSDEEKARIDQLHLRKIDLSDAIMVLNVDGYVGKSVEEEIAYAMNHDKEINWLEPYVEVPIAIDRPDHGRRKIGTQEYLVQLAAGGPVAGRWDQVEYKVGDPYP